MPGADVKALTVDLLGPVPPPFGGVSIHILRYAALLQAQGHGHRIMPYTGLTANSKAGKAFQALGQMLAIHGRLAASRGDVLHVHYGTLGSFLALGPALGRRGARSVITFHSVRVIQELEAAPAWMRRRALALLAGFDLFVAVRQEIGEALRGLGLQGPAITVMPAFLPPAAEEADLGRLPAAVAQALQEAAGQGRPQLCCGAYYLGAGYGHEDIYGVEDLVAAVGRLDAAGAAGLDLWVFVSNAPDDERRRAIEQSLRAQAAGWTRCRLHLHYGLPLIPVLARAAAFVRPSREDGDSVAIREALAFGLPVLASDVVNRPEGVITYAIGEPGALDAALRALLAGAANKNGGGAAVGEADRERYRRFVDEVVGA